MDERRFGHFQGMPVSVWYWHLWENSIEKKFGYQLSSDPVDLPTHGRFMPPAEPDSIKLAWIRLLIAILGEPNEGKSSFSASRARVEAGGPHFTRSEQPERRVRQMAGDSTHQSSSDLDDKED